MTPREFFEEYGQPRVRHISVPIQWETVVSPDPDRYFLAFHTPVVAIMLRTETEPHFESDGSELELPNTQLFYFTHALHGSLVNMGWQLLELGGTGVATVKIYEGYMRSGSQILTHDPLHRVFQRGPIARRKPAKFLNGMFRGI